MWLTHVKLDEKPMDRPWLAIQGKYNHCPLWAAKPTGHIRSNLSLPFFFFLHGYIPYTTCKRIASTGNRIQKGRLLRCEKQTWSFRKQSKILGHSIAFECRAHDLTHDDSQVSTHLYASNVLTPTNWAGLSDRQCHIQSPINPLGNSLSTVLAFLLSLLITSPPSNHDFAWLQ
jgi:hypothetical protein